MQANISSFPSNLEGGINIWLMLHSWKREKAEILIEMYCKLKNVMCLSSWENILCAHFKETETWQQLQYNRLLCCNSLHVQFLTEMYFNYAEIQSLLKGEKRGKPCRVKWTRTLLAEANMLTSNAMIQLSKWI